MTAEAACRCAWLYGFAAGWAGFGAALSHNEKPDQDNVHNHDHDDYGDRIIGCHSRCPCCSHRSDYCRLAVVWPEECYDDYRCDDHHTYQKEKRQIPEHNSPRNPARVAVSCCDRLRVRLVKKRHNRVEHSASDDSVND
jgi:hypothetical protein